MESEIYASFVTNFYKKVIQIRKPLSNVIIRLICPEEQNVILVGVALEMKPQEIEQEQPHFLC